jgi:hypothetical protein
MESHDECLYLNRKNTKHIGDVKLCIDSLFKARYVRYLKFYFDKRSIGEK